MFEHQRIIAQLLLPALVALTTSCSHFKRETRSPAQTESDFEIVETKVCKASRIEALSFAANLGLGRRTYYVDDLYSAAYEICQKYFKDTYAGQSGPRIVHKCDPRRPYEVANYCKKEDITGNGTLEPVCFVKCEFIKITE